MVLCRRKPAVHLCLGRENNTSTLNWTFLTVSITRQLYWVALYFTGVAVTVSPRCSWRAASTLPQPAFTASSPTPHHFADQMQVHMMARTLANLWKRRSQLLLTRWRKNGIYSSLTRDNVILWFAKCWERSMHFVDEQHRNSGTLNILNSVIKSCRWSIVWCQNIFTL